MRFPSSFHHALVASVAAGVIGLFACSGSSSTSGTTPDQACNDLAQTLCDKINSCAPFYLQTTYGDMATCVTRTKINCVPAYAANGTSATPDATETCLADAKTTSCDDLLTRKGPPSCFTQPGQLADGIGCGTDAQCKGTLCRLADNSTCGACSSPGGAGSACNRDEDCTHGFVCSNQKCAAPAAAGGACGTGQPCATSLSCVGGTCAVALEAGAACTPKLNENACDIAKGLYCHPKNKVCALVGTSAAGGQCGIFNDNLVLCTGGSSCKGDNPLTQTPGTCQAAAADGAACNDTTGPKCLTPARCVSGVCKLTDPTTCK